MKLSHVAAAMLAFAIPATAYAGPATFNTTCVAVATATQAQCTSGLTGAAGAVTIAATNDASLKVMISAWQANQNAGGAITSANLGAYSGSGGGGGFGVTGLGDANGANNLHQIDNAGGYTDFLMLQFSRAVQLTSATLNVYGIGNSTDSDLSVFNLGAVMPAPSSWNSSVNLATVGSNDPNIWTQFNGQNSRTAMLNTSAFSQVWLISAAQLPTNDRDDGFKLSQIVVNVAAPAVPEPATWAMLMLGFGAIGANLRRRTAAAGSALTA